MTDQGASSTPTPTTTPPTPTTTTAPDPGRPSSAANLSICPNSTSLPGTDVSDYDPGTVWKTTQGAGIGFAYVKATEGLTFTNNLFASDWAALKNLKMLGGAYHFFHPGSDASQQAQFFLKTVGANAANDLPPLLDWEATDGVSSAAQIQAALTWLKAVEKSTGKIPMIYVSPSFWNTLGNPTGFQRYPLFIAHYGVSCPQIPPPWSKWVFWQTGTGSVPGVQSSQADKDVFNGTLPTLNALSLQPSF